MLLFGFQLQVDILSLTNTDPGSSPLWSDLIL